MYNEDTVGTPFLIGDIMALAEFIQRFPFKHSEECYLTPHVLWERWGGAASGVDPPEEELTT